MDDEAEFLEKLTKQFTIGNHTDLEVELWKKSTMEGHCSTCNRDNISVRRSYKLKDSLTDDFVRPLLAEFPVEDFFDFSQHYECADCTAGVMIGGVSAVIFAILDEEPAAARPIGGALRQMMTTLTNSTTRACCAMLLYQIFLKDTNAKAE